MNTLRVTLDYFDSAPVELPSGGVGDESKEITSRLLEARSRFYENRITDVDWKSIQAKLEQNINIPELLFYSQRFVAAIPKWLKCPTLEFFEDEQEVEFEWFEENYRVVNAVVTADGKLYYSGLLGRDKRRAEKDAVVNGVPQGLVSAIQRINSTR